MTPCLTQRACAPAQELAHQQTTYRALMARNRNRSMEQLQGENRGSSQLTALPLPFVLIQVSCAVLLPPQLADTGIFQFHTVCLSDKSYSLNPKP